MQRLAAAWRVAVRNRYAVLGAWALIWFLVPFLQTIHHTVGDWGFFEYGARTLVHYNAHYSDGPLHLYAKDPQIQVGPLPLALVATLVWLPPHVMGSIFAVVMLGMGLGGVRLADLTARTLSPGGRRADDVVLLGGLVSMAVWAVDVANYRHLDDAIAITAVLAAALVVARGRNGVLAGVLVGLALASKPWALALAPVLLGLPSRDRPRAALAAMGVAAAAWAPFVIADHATVTSLGSFRLLVNSHSALHTLGVHSWIAPDWVRPAQLVGGFGLGALVARRGRWLAVPLAAVAVRVMFDPQVWSYYGQGPVMCALLLDVTTASLLPWRTAAAVVAEYLVPLGIPAAAGPARLAWAASIVVVLIWPRSFERPLIWSAWRRPTTSRPA